MNWKLVSNSLSFLALAAAAPIPVAQAQAIAAAGRVVDVTPPGSVVIEHSDKKRNVAAHGVLLRPGDWLDFQRDGELIANVFGQRMTYTEASPERTIPTRPIGRYSAKDLSYFERFVQFLSNPRAAIPVFPWVRGAPTSAIALMPSRFAPTGRTLVPNGTRQLALSWQSGPAILLIHSPGAVPARLESRRNPWALVPLADMEGVIRITAEGQMLSWTVERDDRVPHPPWMAGNGPLSEAQRLVRAVWLLQSGPAEWRTFALSELAQLSDQGSFPANQLWIGARSGELAETLWP